MNSRFASSSLRLSLAAVNWIKISIGVCHQVDKNVIQFRWNAWLNNKSACIDRNQLITKCRARCATQWNEWQTKLTGMSCLTLQRTTHYGRVCITHVRNWLLDCSINLFVIYVYYSCLSTAKRERDHMGFSCSRNLCSAMTIVESFLVVCKWIGHSIRP